MNVQQLSEIGLGRVPEWTFEDVTQWLEKILMKEYQQIFLESKIDGSMLMILDEDDLISGLQIKNMMHRKRINKALGLLKSYSPPENAQEKIQIFQDDEQKLNLTANKKYDLSQGGLQIDISRVSRNDLFEQYQNKIGNEQENVPQFGDVIHDSDEDSQEDYFDDNKEEEQYSIDQDSSEEPLEESKEDLPTDLNHPFYIKPEITTTTTSPHELILQPVDETHKYIFRVNESGAKVGRQSSNNLVLCDESVSRFHCEILCKNNTFFIQDLGSTTGTYIRIRDKFVLSEGQSVELGSNQFLVQSIFMQGENLGTIILKIKEGLEEALGKSFTIMNKGSIGRKTTNDICFENDLHLSNLHSVFSIEHGKFILEDMSSTNGSWYRLSEEQKKSELCPITDKDEIKIGLQCTFSAKLFDKNEQKNEEEEIFKKERSSSEKKLVENNRCDICYMDVKNAVLLPCKHNCTCINCSKNLDKCPICRQKVNEFIKIYKS